MEQLKRSWEEGSIQPSKNISRRVWDKAFGLWHKALGLWDKAFGLWDKALGLQLNLSKLNVQIDIRQCSIQVSTMMGLTYRYLTSIMWRLMIHMEEIVSVHRCLFWSID